MASAAPDVEAMVSSLESRLNANPDDLSGWLMLGRSYVALERFGDAVQAYDRALRLQNTNVDAQLGKGESLSLQANGQITPEAAQLFEQAVRADPTNPKALLFGGFAAVIAGNAAAARERWTQLKALNPPPQIARMLDLRLAALSAEPSMANAKPQPPAAAGAGSAEVVVTVRISPELRGRLGADTPLFVFARDPDLPGPPLAVKKLSRSEIGQSIRLSSADAMIPARVLRVGQKVLISARLSASGNPTPGAGDLYGQVPYDVVAKGAVDVLIDRITQ